MDAYYEETFGGKLDLKRPLIKLTDEYSPDSPYGVSKVFGEALGKYYSCHKNAFEFIALRIGWISYKDPSVLKGTLLEDYLRAMWLSTRDCKGFF